MTTRRTVALFVAAIAVLGGCGKSSSPSSSSSGVDVTAAFYPLAEVAARVGGARVHVTNMTPPGTEPHDLELTPKQVDTIESADVVVYLGKHFQPALAEAAKRSKGEKVDALPEDPTDPHVWLDPVRMSGIVDRVTAALVKADDAGSLTYEANAIAYKGELATLDREFTAGLMDCARKRIVTAHEAFGYLAARYGLTQTAITGLSPESEPDPKRLAELADEVKADGTTTVFTETLVSPKVADTLAREAGVTTAVLNPLEGLTPDEVKAGASYVSVMRANLATLRTALGCP
ncbi:MAG: zinc transport system substrate-binding protein [Actinomycetota bacterium]|jgi:zinc transport system substrate-binding protein|nr:zinc transport system substrate-binding protein [Actinomycetota bacterium]